MLERLKFDRALDGWMMHHRNRGVPHHMHRHAELELNLVARGCATYLMSDRRRIDLRRDTLIWLFPRQDHILINQTDDFEMWVVVFRPAMVRRWTRPQAARVLSHPSPAGNFSRRLKLVDASRLGSLLGDLAGAMAQLPQWPRFNAGLPYALLSAWWAFLDAEGSDDSGGRLVHEAVEAAARIVRDEPEPCGIDVLARRCGTSPSHLSRMFKRQTGIALVSYRQKMCLERFLKIYRGGEERNMMQAALQAGFGSYPQFHRVFKRYMNRSPAEFRREASDQPPANVLKQFADSRALARQ